MRFAVTAAVFLGALGGSFAFAAAVSVGSDPFEMPGEPSVSTWSLADPAEVPAGSSGFDEEPSLFAATFAAAPASSGDVSILLANDDVTARMYREGSQLCVAIEVRLDGSVPTTCDSPDAWATGLAFLAYRSDGVHPVLVVGIVPDGVSTVSVDGDLVNVENNAWFIRSHRPTLMVEVTGGRGETVSEAIEVVPPG